jgi:hypothetical protein
MLIKFFRSSFLIQYFFLVILTGLIWAPGFLMKNPAPEPFGLATPIYSLAFRLLALADWISPLAAAIIIFTSALTLNNVLIYHDISPKNNLLPAFLFILLMGSTPPMLGFYPVVLIIPFFIWFLHTLFRVNDEPENFMAVFNSSLILSIITMILPEMLWLFFVIWIMLLVFGVFNGRNLLISFIGLWLPYVYLAVYYFWTDQLTAAIDNYASYFLQLAGQDFRVGIGQMVVWGVLFLLMLVPAFFRLTGTLSSFNISYRKKIAATAWLLVFTLPLVLVTGPLDHHSLIFLPASIMIAAFYNTFKKAVWHEIILLSFLLLLLANQYLRLIDAAGILS